MINSQRYMVLNPKDGDVDYDEVSEQVAAITPVPGGVGTVTTSVLLKHTLESAERILVINGYSYS